MDLNDLPVLPRSKNKYLSGAFFTLSIQKKVGELCNLVEETFGCLNNVENHEMNC